jgi:hypothetical protein
MASADVMAITKWSISDSRKAPLGAGLHRCARHLRGATRASYFFEGIARAKRFHTTIAKRFHTTIRAPTASLAIEALPGGLGRAPPPKHDGHTFRSSPGRPAAGALPIFFAHCGLAATHAPE